MSNEKVRKLLEEANRVNSIPSILTGNGTKAIALGIVQIQESVAGLTEAVNGLRETLSSMQNPESIAGLMETVNGLKETLSTIPTTNTELVNVVNGMKETLGMFISALESEETMAETKVSETAPAATQEAKS